MTHEVKKQGEVVKSSSRSLLSSLLVCVALAATGAALAEDTDFITGKGLPNSNPVVVPNKREFPAGRNWGSTAGIDIEPTDGHIWACDRYGALNFCSGVPLNCDTNPFDPIFKFNRHTGEVMANVGGCLMQTPHGIHAAADGTVWVTDFAANADGTKGHQVHQFSADGELLMSLGKPSQSGTGPDVFNQANDVIVGPDGSIYVSDGHNGRGMTSNQAMEESPPDERAFFEVLGVFHAKSGNALHLLSAPARLLADFHQYFAWRDPAAFGDIDRQYFPGNVGVDF